MSSTLSREQAETVGGSPRASRTPPTPLAFEADDVGRIRRLIRHLRAPGARLYTENELPFITDIRKPLAEILADLPYSLMRFQELSRARFRGGLDCGTFCPAERRRSGDVKTTKVPTGDLNLVEGVSAVFAGVQIVHFAGALGSIGPTWRGVCSHGVLTGNPCEEW